MIKKRITTEQLHFITQSIFELGRAFLGEPHLEDLEVDELLVKTSVADDTVSSIFLEGYTYLMTVDTKALNCLN